MISLGEELRREREFREISLKEISEATKINIRILEAIERDDYKLLPGGIFNRNFIRAYAQFIGLDPEIAVRKYQVQSLEKHEEKYPPTLISPAKPDTVGSLRVRILIFLLLVVVLMVVLFWLDRTGVISLGEEIEKRAVQWIMS